MWRRLCVAALLPALVAGPASAAVVIAFYAHHLGNRGMWVEFPHAYLTLIGTPDAGGPTVKTNFHAAGGRSLDPVRQGRRRGDRRR